MYTDLYSGLAEEHIAAEMQNQEILAENERPRLAELNAGVADEHLASMRSRISLA